MGGSQAPDNVHVQYSLERKSCLKLTHVSVNILKVNTVRIRPVVYEPVHVL